MLENFRPGIIFHRINSWTGRVCSVHRGPTPARTEGTAARSPELTGGGAKQRGGHGKLGSGLTGARAALWIRAMVVRNREAAALGEDNSQECREGKEAGERCGATRGWCSPFIGAGGAPRRKCRWVTAEDLRLTPLMAGEGVKRASRGGIKAGE
jgi:hypothetical protein